MTPGQFAVSLRNAWRLVKRLGLDNTFSTPSSLPIDAEFRDLALDRKSAYESIFLCGLRKSHYNFMLNDFSYFQFSHDENGGRYVFLPNPFSDDKSAQQRLTLEEFLKAEIITFEEYSQEISESSVSIGVPIFRYEYAPGQYREAVHPTAHFHIGHDHSNRWALERRFSPLLFCMMIFRNYYPEAWSKFDNSGAEFFNALTDELALERDRCEKLDAARFSPKERRLLYFT